ncbi:hypothetical protein [Bacillus wiedmannii]|uniref:hypothetical protein n=1 Tax=Bacillus wiedmannii TaxID=1890302 RepID=UPI00211D83CD|nr:hypothetical protein [Bacillus wiedmannii]
MQGYYYHVAIREQVQLTYEEYLTEKNRGKAICTNDPDDDTDYEKSIRITIRKHLLLTKNWKIW